MELVNMANIHHFQEKPEMVLLEKDQCNYHIDMGNKDTEQLIAKSALCKYMKHSQVLLRN